MLRTQVLMQQLLQLGLFSPIKKTNMAPEIIPKIWTNGNNGDSNVGLYQSCLGFSLLRTITQAFSATITMIWNPDANFATSLTGNVRMHIPIATPVRIIDHCGVPNRWLVSTSVSQVGDSLWPCQTKISMQQVILKVRLIS